ncbi:MAG: hypothetical protein H6719_19195 [Sandaracinaceae bacterium]|nr:hypothetical protein [Sandaracinaceae bacterium]
MPRDDAAAQLSFLPGARPAGRYDTASDDEAAAIGRALVAELRGDALTMSQRTLLDTARANAPEPEERAPGPVLDADQTLLSLSRGDDAEVRVRWRRYRGSAHFLDVRRFERGDRGELLPTRQGVTIRGHEVQKLLAALVKLEAGRAGEEAVG